MSARSLRARLRSGVVLSALGLAAAFGHGRPARVDAQPSVAIHDVTLVDVVSGSLRPNTTVIVEGSRISMVAPAARSPVPKTARLIEGRGLFLIPGLWDMHSHSLWSAEALRTFLPLYVAHGVTGIRDMGGRLDVLAAARDAQRVGDEPWPRLIAAGAVLDGPQPVQPDISIAVSDAEAAVAAVGSLARAGADFVKVYTLLPRPAYFAAIEEARRRGLSVAGHVPGAVSPREAALSGQRSIEHLRDEIELACARAASEECAGLAAVFRRQRTWQVPTLVTLRAKAHFDEPGLAADPRLRYVPAALRAEWLAWREQKLGRGRDYLESKRERYAEAEWLTGFFAREGVPLLAGSDAGVAFCHPGFGLHDELTLLVRAGLTPLDALRAATLGPAEYLGARDSMGAIEAGQVGDLVLLRANPLTAIEATREIEAVVLRGRVLVRSELDTLLEAAAARAAP